MRLLKWIAILAIVIFLTALTQVGGVLFLLGLPFFRKIKELVADKWLRRTANLFTYVGLYALSSFIVIPMLAPAFGRVLMPENDYLRPASGWYRIFNRTYARPELADIMDVAAASIYYRYPGSVVFYMDAGFPFFNNFSMPFHLSHKEGKSLDVAFFYFDTQAQAPTNDRPSLTGYGIFESPRGGEEMTTEYCKSKGFNNYDVTKWLALSFDKTRYRFDPARTEALIRAIVKDDRVQGVLIEPHLEKRLKLDKTSKIKNPGCNAVRHDDHFHVSIR